MRLCALSALSFGIGLPVLGDEVVPALHIGADLVGAGFHDGRGGLDFVVHERIEVMDLGIYDSGLDGVERPATAQIWSRNDGGTPDDFGDDTGGEVLASLEFEGERGTLIGSTRFLPLARPVILEPGSYTLTGWHGGVDWPHYDVPEGAAPEDHGITIADPALVSFVGLGRYGVHEDIAEFPAVLNVGPAVKFAALNFRFACATDTDGDGLRDWWEKRYALDPLDAADAGEDPDGDGLSNLAEFEKGTLPREADTDGDGLADGVETGTGVWVSVLDTGSDPRNADSDGDLLPDGRENPGRSHDPANPVQVPGTNPNSPDSDGDGASDGLEAALGSDPTDAASRPPRAEPYLREDFDGASLRSDYTFDDSGTTPGQVADSGEPRNGMVARLTDLVFPNNNSVAWDFVPLDAKTVVLSFGFRITDDAASDAASGCCGEAGSGFGIGLFSTDTYGEIGANNPGGGTKEWEDPRTTGGWPDAFFVSFDLFNFGTGSGGNNVRVTGPAEPGKTLADVEAPFPLNDNRFHRAEITIVNDGEDSLVFLALIEDVHGAGAKHQLAGLRVPELDLRGNFPARLIMGARNDRSAASIEIDDVLMSVRPGPRLALTIGTDPSGANLQFEWEGKAGMFYRLRSSSDPEAERDAWDLVEVDGLTDLPGTVPVTRYAIPRPTEAVRFYRVEEFPLPPVTIFEERFDTSAAGSLPPGWTTGFGVGDTAMNTAWQLGDPAGGPVTGPPAASSAPHCVGTNLRANYGTNSRTWLRTPPIDLTGTTAATVRFQQWLNIDEFEDMDRGTVRVLAAGGLPATVTELAVVQGNINGVTQSGWAAFSAKLPSAALGGRIVLEFEFVSDDFAGFDEAGWYLDDLAVSASVR